MLIHGVDHAIDDVLIRLQALRQTQDVAFRPAHLIFQDKNRRIAAKDGLLALDFCRRVFEWLVDFERRWDYPLLAAWQKEMVRAGWQGRASLPEIQAACGGQLPLPGQALLSEHVELNPGRRSANGKHQLPLFDATNL